jgi:proline iminopeptidase
MPNLAETWHQARVASATFSRKLTARLQYQRLYPRMEPYDRGMLEVSPIHRLYYEQSGNPDGKPVVLLHGGPGGGTTPDMRRYFHPSRYRIILFDQRGCGRSRPQGCLEENTTWHLVDDMEVLRKHLAINAWMVFGGSWGVTLALAYAQKYRQNVTEIVLRGVFTASQRELAWIYEAGGTGRIFPEAWRKYESVIPPDEREDMIGAYYRRLTSSDEAVQLEAALAWSAWEASTSTLIPDNRLATAFANKQFALALARIECHYFVNGAFLTSDSQLLDGLDAIRSIPTVIVHGRYDVICPAENASRLHEKWPESRLVVVPDAGHSGFEAGICHHLVQATDEFS